jgi:hypothetical protein
MAGFYAFEIKNNSGRIKVPPGRWEAVSRVIGEGQDKGKSAVYARYLGPEEPTK